MEKRDFKFGRRVVIKVGTSILRRANRVDGLFLKHIAAQIAAVRAQNARQVVLVSSGAVGFGMMRLGLARRPRDTATLQAAAAIGQPELMRAWAGAFGPHRVRVSQLLLTNDGLQMRDRFLNAKNALLRILDLGVVPIVNENDTVAVEELTFGDNDMLSALVAAMIDADLLINLTDVDGFKGPDQQVMHTVALIRREWIKAAPAENGFTVGGMPAKLKAAQIAVRAGIPVVIANGRAKNVLESILQGGMTGTLFLPNPAGLKGKKVWLSFFRSPAGQIVVDRGAASAVTRNGKSLLPGGILRSRGNFPRQSCVSIVDESGLEIARGISFYSAEEISAIAGSPSAGIRARLNLSDRDDVPAEVVHRNNMALVES